MTAKAAPIVDQDGSIYAAEIVPPEGDNYGAKFHVDLIRASMDDHGLEREQRLTVGQYGSWMEAEEHLHAVEDDLAEHGLEALGESVQRLREQPFSADRVYLTAVYPPDGLAEAGHAAHLLAIGTDRVDSVPLSLAGVHETAEAVVSRVDGVFAAEGIDAGLMAAREEAERSGARSMGTALFDRDVEAIRHIDGGGTAHWFEIVERDAPDSDPYELRYFRELALEDGSQRRDSYSVMPLPDDDPGSAWPLPGLETHLRQGDVFMAQMLAHNVADAYGQVFPEPEELPALDPRPEYYFGYGVGPSNAPSLEAVKTWMDGSERRFDTLTVAEYDTYDEVAIDESQFETILRQQGIESAMNLAETMAAANGYLDPQRVDPRIFFADDAPPDAFTTNRTRQLAGPDVAAADPASAVDNPYWRFDTLPVVDRAGEPLGQSLHMVVYPHIAHDPERIGTPAMTQDEPFHMLEVAHFETDEAAEKFIAEFNGYLMPGLLEGPELAQEVARLEGLPVEWKTLDGDDLTAYQNLALTLTHDPADWHPYNPNAERDARIEAEGLYTDPIQQFAKMDEGEDEPKVEPVSPDFDL